MTIRLLFIYSYRKSTFSTFIGTKVGTQTRKPKWKVVLPGLSKNVKLWKYVQVFSRCEWLLETGLGPVQNTKSFGQEKQFWNCRKSNYFLVAYFNKNEHSKNLAGFDKKTRCWQQNFLISKKKVASKVKSAIFHQWLSDQLIVQSVAEER